jgi:hypothetical protein
MFGWNKQDKPDRHPIYDFEESLDQAISSALKVGCRPSVLADLLETRADNLNIRSALAYSSAPRVVSGNLGE